MKTWVRIEGLRELEKALQELPRATAKNVMRRGLIEAAQPTLEHARSLVPVATGGLRDSLEVSTKAKRGFKKDFSGANATGRSTQLPSASAIQVYIGPSFPDGFHGHLIEFGTSRTSPQAFLRPAWDATKDQVLASISGFTWGQLKKAADRLARKTARAAKKAAKVARRHAAG